MGWSEAQFEAYQRKRGVVMAVAETVPERPQPSQINKAEAKAEKVIHTLIIQELHRRQIKFVHAAMNKRSTLPEGHPDFAIYLPMLSLVRDGAVWFVEVKTETGKLSKAQESYIADLRQEGFQVSVPRSFEEFIQQLNKLLLR